MFSTLSFLRLPRRMTVELIYLHVYWIIFVVPNDYISENISTCAVVTGRVYDYDMLYGPGSQYGEYVCTYEKTNNTMRSRTVSAITLRPTVKSLGNWKTAH